jgi:hypothetical protein
MKTSLVVVLVVTAACLPAITLMPRNAPTEDPHGLT